MKLKVKIFKRYRPIVIVYVFISKFWEKLPTFLTYKFSGIFYGFWLGLLTKTDIHQIDSFNYSRSTLYFNKEYNKSGLWEWEKHALEKYFADKITLLVAGAGAGREVLALKKNGYDAYGFECNLDMVTFSESIFIEEGIKPSIFYVPPDKCLKRDQYYDGLIIGWCAYMHIQGKKARINFLKDMRGQVKIGAPILISFWSKSDTSTEKLKHIFFVANAIRRVLRRTLVEEGDSLDSRGFVHFFTVKEIENELLESGFVLLKYFKEGHHHILGRATEKVY